MKLERAVYDQYTYKGPVMMFDSCVSNNYEASTYATSTKKARSNIAYQYKKKNNLSASAKITLPGELTKVLRKEGGRE